MAILEGMRAGKPTIATKVGGIPEIITEGIHGFLIPENSLEQLVEKLSVLVENPPLRQKMGLNARKRYEDVFLLEKMMEETIRIYSIVEQ